MGCCALAPSVWQEIAVDRFKNRGVEDVVSGEHFISWRNARRILGEDLRVKRVLQVRALMELDSLGLIEVVNRRLIKVPKK